MSATSAQYKFIEGFSSSSASPTDIWVVERDGQQYVLKIWIDKIVLDAKHNKYIDFPNVDFLRHEVEIYNYIKGNIIIPNNSRNLLSIQDSTYASFNDLLKILQTSKNKTKAQWKNNLIYNTIKLLTNPKDRIQIDGPDIMGNLQNKTIKMEYDGVLHEITATDNIIYRYICTQNMNGTSLTDYITTQIKKNNFNLKEFLNYAMLILCGGTLTLSLGGVTHNDFHYGNIMLSPHIHGPTEFHKKNYLFVTNSEIMIVNNPYTPIIYDFDRSVLKDHEYKEFEPYQYAGNCTTYHPKRDFLKFICQIYKFLIAVKTKTSSFKLQQDITDLLKNMWNELGISTNLKNQIIKISNNSCFFETPVQLSTLCMDDTLDTELASITDICSWIVSKSSYKRYPIDIILENELPNEIRQLFPTNMTDDKFKFYLIANIQFMGTFTENDKNSFIKNLSEKLLPKTKYQKFISFISKFTPM